MTHADLIATLGGAKTVADFLGIPNPNTVTYWGRWEEGRSIPAHHWPRLVEMEQACKNGITLASLAGSLAAQRDNRRKGERPERRPAPAEAA